MPPRLALAAAGLAAFAFMAPSVLFAQTAPAVAEPPVVEILMEVASEGAACRPPQAGLPARSPIEIRLVNPSASAISFIATKFFEGSNVEGATGAVDEGAGYLVGPGVTARIAVKSTPPEGAFPYTCAMEREGRTLEGVGGTLTIVPPATAPRG
jgi:hypothetical protein